MKHFILFTLAFTISAMTAWGKAAGSNVVPLTKGAHCTFTDGVRYSELVINARLNDFKANTTAAGFGVFDATGHQTTAPTGTKNNLDYVPGLVANYLESSCTAIFTAAYLKGIRLGLFDTDYTDIARRAYRGFVEQFMVSDGKGGVHLIGCCKSAGLGGSNYRDGSAAYYLMGRDTQPTVDDPSSSSFYTEGKVFGGFILAATEYERRFMDGVETHIDAMHNARKPDNGCYDIQGRRVTAPHFGIHIVDGRKCINKD